MRVLHIIPSISPLDGGPSGAIQALTRALARQGVEVDLATTDGHGVRHLAVPDGRPVTRDGVRHFFFHRQANFYSFCGGFALWLMRHARDYDLFHLHGLFSFPSTFASLLARSRGIPYVVQPHGSMGTWGFANRRPFLKSQSLRFVEQPLIRNAASLYLNTDLETRECREIGITRPVDVVPYAMALPEVDRQAFADRFFQTYPQFRSRRIVLFLSRIHPKKGIDILLEAFQKISAEIPDAMLVIVGEGETEYVAKLKTMVDELHLNAAVEFIGFLSGEMKWSAIAAADLFVLPTHSENFGIAVVEAMSAGTPVVVTPGAAVSSFVASAGGGVVVERDRESMSEAIIRLLSDIKALRKLGEVARQAAKLCSADEVAIRTRDLYSRLIGASTGKKPVGVQPPVEVGETVLANSPKQNRTKT